MSIKGGPAVVPDDASETGATHEDIFTSLQWDEESRTMEGGFYKGRCVQFKGLTFVPRLCPSLH